MSVLGEDELKEVYAKMLKAKGDLAILRDLGFIQEGEL